MINICFDVILFRSEVTFHHIVFSYWDMLWRNFRQSWKVDRDWSIAHLHLLPCFSILAYLTFLSHLVLSAAELELYLAYLAKCIGADKKLPNVTNRWMLYRVDQKGIANFFLPFSCKALPKFFESMKKSMHLLFRKKMIFRSPASPMKFKTYCP